MIEDVFDGMDVILAATLGCGIAQTAAKVQRLARAPRGTPDPQRGLAPARTLRQRLAPGTSGRGMPVWSTC
ncbi:hypothetical protein GCM10007893_00780 [Paracoccus marinus]|nr:hypothetical protein GCM10007893_00780 [Paracoccus marinus]